VKGLAAELRAKPRRLVAAAVLVVVIGVAIAALGLQSGSKKTAAAAPAVHPAAPAHAAAVPSAKRKPKSVPPRVMTCPLTGMPVRAVRRRPALLVKIGNEPGPSRPQSGLNEADIVYDTPAEGFIMRYMAVYQCSDASRIGPLRSVRWVDYHLAPQFGAPILAFAGGIDPNVQAVASMPAIAGANVVAGQQNAGYRTSDRLPPDNLYSSTAALYGLYPQRAQPPNPVFRFSGAVPAGAAVLASAELRFSGGTDVVWQWSHATRSWVHTYAGSSDVDGLTQQPVSATNVVVQIVSYSIGPYIESTGGSGDVQSETTGTGRGFLMRDGHYLPVVWHRAGVNGAMTLNDVRGRPVALAPGRTWIELMTTTQAANGIHFTP
jgi:hypothetical protein